MRKTLWRAAKDDYIGQGFSFAESRDVAEFYLTNRGFGGPKLYRAKLDVDPGQVIDLTEMSCRQLSRKIGVQDPGAIGLDEWLPQSPEVLDALRDSDFIWALVRESYPEETTTWIWLGRTVEDMDIEPELVEII